MIIRWLVCAPPFATCCAAFLFWYHIETFICYFTAYANMFFSHFHCGFDMWVRTRGVFVCWQIHGFYSMKRLTYIVWYPCIRSTLHSNSKEMGVSKWQHQRTPLTEMHAMYPKKKMTLYRPDQLFRQITWHRLCVRRHETRALAYPKTHGKTSFVVLSHDAFMSNLFTNLTRNMKSTTWQRIPLDNEQ